MTTTATANWAGCCSAAKSVAYTFVGIDPETKLIPCFTIGKRDGATALEFMSDLHSRLSDDCRPQLTTDGFSPYLGAGRKHLRG